MHVLCCVSVPNELLAQGEFPLVLGLLQLVPGLVDVGDELALGRQVGPLVVGSHLGLQREQHDLQVTLLHKPATQTGHKT